MGQRELRRVPLDFDWPVGIDWEGFEPPDDYEYPDECLICDGAGCIGCDFYGDDLTREERNSPDRWQPYDPPVGEGWQLWQTTTEGGPTSPVFKTAEELADWCADNETLYGINGVASKNAWLNLLLQPDDLNVASSLVKVHTKSGTYQTLGINVITQPQQPDSD